MPCARHGPACHGHPSEPDYERPTLDAGELRAVFAAARSDEERAVFLLCYDLALRCSEACRVRGADVDWARGTIRPPRLKKGKVADLAVARETLAAIRPFAKGPGPIFPRWSGDRVRGAFRRAVRRAGLPSGPARDGGKGFSHGLRRGRATHMLSQLGERGLKYVQRQLGHKSLRSTMGYLGLTAEEQARTAEVATGLVRAALGEKTPIRLIDIPDPEDTPSAKRAKTKKGHA